MPFKAIFFAAPHRVMFAAGAAQTLLAILFWTVDLGARYAGFYAPPAWPVPSVWLHAALMIYGVFPFFIFGFLMTVMPRWVAPPALTPRQYLPPFLLLAAGWLDFYLGLAAPALLPLGLAIAALGWFWGWCSLWQAARRPHPDKRHAWAVLAANLLGALGLAAFAVGLQLGDAGWVRLAIEVGVWGCLLPTFVVVSHRMLPFFSSTMIRGYTLYRSMPLLWAILACFGAHALLAVADLRGWSWLPDGIAAGLAFWFSWKWQIHKSFVAPLLAMHHVATLWLGLALALYAGQSLFGGLGLAPLHALGIGYFASMLLGMATRVTLGHSGQAPVSDGWTWAVFWLFQSVVLLRLAGEFRFFAGFANLYWLAGCAWLLFFGIWFFRHMPIYFKPRPDGQPG